MKQKTKEGIICALIFIGAMAILFMALCYALKPVDFTDTNKFKIETYYVEKGDCAWNIYKKTCSNYDWYDWGEFVKNRNGISNLSNLQAGDVIEIPIPIK